MKKQSQNKVYPNFSVAMSVYYNDNPLWLETALESILNQTLPPSEIILVVDGKIPKAIESVINKFKSYLKVIYLPENRGLGNALKTAIKNCKYNLIARMDSDDLSVNNRFELQIAEFLRNKSLDICGGQIEEFIDEVSNIVGKRIVPIEDQQIKEFLKRRCPFNHMTVMFKKSSILKVGNYLDWPYNEDYYLWARMTLANMNFCNLPQVLVKVRVGKEMYNRRGGLGYFISEYKLQKYLLNNKIINFPTYFLNVTKRLIVQLVLPNNVRGWIYKNFARRKPNEKNSCYHS